MGLVRNMLCFDLTSITNNTNYRRIELSLTWPKAIQFHWRSVFSPLVSGTSGGDCVVSASQDGAVHFFQVNKQDRACINKLQVSNRDTYQLGKNVLFKLPQPPQKNSYTHDIELEGFIHWISWGWKWSSLLFSVLFFFNDINAKFVHLIREGFL